MACHIWSLKSQPKRSDFNGLGQRVSQTVSAVETEYLLDVQPGLWKVIAADDGTNVNRYIHDPVTGRILRHEGPSNDWNWPALDGLGTVRGVYDDTLTEVYAANRDPYGDLIAATGTNPTPFEYTGEPEDPNGLLHLRARYYDPSLGVFNSLDPVETANRYAYVGGDPINRVDKSGLIGQQDMVTLASAGGVCQQTRNCSCYSDQWAGSLLVNLCNQGLLPTCSYGSAPPTDNCVFQCLLGNREWMQIAGQIERNQTRPEDVPPETMAAAVRSFNRAQACIQTRCNVHYIGVTPHIGDISIPPPTFADSEYPQDCGAFRGAPEACMSAHLQFLRNTQTMTYLHELPSGYDTSFERAALFGSFVAPDPLWEQYHDDGTPADVKNFYIEAEYADVTPEGLCMTMYGQSYATDVPGNIIFGFLARQAGFSDFGSLASAGLAQILDNLTTGSQWSSVNILTDFGDSPEDQTAIRMGMELYNRCGSSQCTDQDFMAVLNSYRSEYVEAASISPRAECRPTSTVWRKYSVSLLECKGSKVQ